MLPKNKQTSGTRIWHALFWTMAMLTVHLKLLNNFENILCNVTSCNSSMISDTKSNQNQNSILHVLVKNMFLKYKGLWLFSSGENLTWNWWFCLALNKTYFKLFESFEEHWVWNWCLGLELQKDMFGTDVRPNSLISHGNTQLFLLGLRYPE
jgi:hypothetical protein